MKLEGDHKSKMNSFHKLIETEQLYLMRMKIVFQKEAPSSTPKKSDKEEPKTDKSDKSDKKSGWFNMAQAEGCWTCRGALDDDDHAIVGVSRNGSTVLCPGHLSGKRLVNSLGSDCLNHGW